MGGGGRGRFGENALQEYGCLNPSSFPTHSKYYSIEPADFHVIEDQVKDLREMLDV
jgi:hypothetical protein